jgi:hypothetical protein
VDQELDAWICNTLGILPARELREEDLHQILIYYFPNSEVCNDAELIKSTGCAYIKLDKSDPDDRAILISSPTENKVKIVMYYCILKIAHAIKNKEKKLHICKIL